MLSSGYLTKELIVNQVKEFTWSPTKWQHSVIHWTWEKDNYENVAKKIGSILQIIHIYSSEVPKRLLDLRADSVLKKLQIWQMIYWNLLKQSKQTFLFVKES